LKRFRRTWWLKKLLQPRSIPRCMRLPDSARKASTDDVVARVLAGLSPEVMQAITRELLKPVVEAMVKEELKKEE